MARANLRGVPTAWSVARRATGPGRARARAAAGVARRVLARPSAGEAANDEDSDKILHFPAKRQRDII